MLLSTDTDKAFDRVSWRIMRSILQYIKIGTNAMKWKEALFDYPTAGVKANGILSTSSILANGTRQGCPLSPLLFIVTLQPLLRRISCNPDITGVQVEKTSHKVAAFLDDPYACEIFFLKPAAISEVFELCF